MRKEVILSIIVILFIGFIHSAIALMGDSESIDPLEGTTAGQITEVVKVNPDTGQIDFSKSNLKTAAEDRIILVNKWFKEKTPWMKYVFGMSPEISWAFIFVFLVWFFFLSLFIVVLPKWVANPIIVLTDLPLKGAKALKIIVPLIGLGLFFLLVISGGIISLAQVIGGTSRGLLGNIIVFLAVIFAIVILFVFDNLGSKWSKIASERMKDDEIFEKSEKAAEKVAKNIKEDGEHHDKDLGEYGSSWVDAEAKEDAKNIGAQTIDDEPV